MKFKKVAFDKELSLSRRRTLKKFLKLAELVMIVDDKVRHCTFLYIQYTTII